MNEYNYSCTRGTTEFVLYSSESPFQVLLGTATNNLSNSVRFYVLAESSEQVNLVRLHAKSVIEPMSDAPVVPLSRDMLLFIDLCSLNTRSEYRYMNWVQVLHVTHVQCTSTFRFANREHYAQPIPENVARNLNNEDLRIENAAANRSNRVLDSMPPGSPIARAVSTAATATFNSFANLGRNVARVASPYRRASSSSPPNRVGDSPIIGGSWSANSRHPSWFWHDPSRVMRRDDGARPIRSRRFSVAPVRNDEGQSASRSFAGQQQGQRQPCTLR